MHSSIPILCLAVLSTAIANPSPQWVTSETDNFDLEGIENVGYKDPTHVGGYSSFNLAKAQPSEQKQPMQDDDQLTTEDRGPDLLCTSDETKQCCDSEKGAQVRESAYFIYQCFSVPESTCPFLCHFKGLTRF